MFNEAFMKDIFMDMKSKLLEYVNSFEMVLKEKVMATVSDNGS